MPAALKALLAFLAALLFGWLVVMRDILGWLQGSLANAAARGRLAGRAAKGADSNCIPIRHPAYRQPDPLIYDQYFLMGLGLAVTWDNPDITLQRGGVTVASSELLPDTDYDIVARVWNGSVDAPVMQLPVYFSYLEFGIGMTAHAIDNGVPTQVDLGVKGGAGCPAFATKRWRTPRTAGHYCLLVFLAWADDANPLNNLGQENLAIGVAHSPAQFTFMLRNDGTERRDFRFETDGYRLPEPRPCDEVRRPTDADLRDRAVRPKAWRIAPVLDARVRARHERAAHPLPAGWRVALDPPEVALEPGEVRSIRVEATPPAGYTGTQPINVRAVHGDTPAGGVTLLVTRS